MPSISTPSDTSINKFHFGLNVSDLHRSVEFYRLLFGQSPAKHLDDYAKFELSQPALVMSLLPNSQLRGGTLSHLGIRLSNSDELVAVQRRLEESGIATRREEGVECCYSKQTKFWVPDPDANLWEMYTVHEDIDHHGQQMAPRVTAMPVEQSSSSKRVWEHRMRTPLPKDISPEAGVFDEVRLEGTFGEHHEPSELREFLGEVWKVLRPGGQVHVHNLVADRPFADGMPTLPGPAAVVRYVPQEAEVAKLLEQAGFKAAKFDKLGNQPCFKVNGVELREMRFSAFKPLQDTRGSMRTIVYRGPFASATDDDGNTYECGVHVNVKDATWQLLQNTMPESFLEIPRQLPELTQVCCTQ